jgi:hypothetical protein
MTPTAASPTSSQRSGVTFDYDKSGRANRVEAEEKLAVAEVDRPRK